MKRKVIVGLFIGLGVIVLLLGYGIYRFGFSMSHLPEGEFLFESTSPQGSYTVKLYETNSALSVGGTRGEVIYNKTGKKRNIYWEYARNLFEAGILESQILWENDEIVVINGKRLNVKKDTYDWRRK